MITKSMQAVINADDETGKRDLSPMLQAVEYRQKKIDEAWLVGRLNLMPYRWADYLSADFLRRGGLKKPTACLWLLGVTEAGRGRLALSASDDDIRAAAKEAAKEGLSITGAAAGDGAYRHRAGVSVQMMEGPASLARGGGFGRGAALSLLCDLCERWGVEPAPVKCVDDILPAIKRMTCPRWWVRRLRRAHGRRGEGAAIVGGVVRRGLWAYASQDCVDRRQAQRRRNAAALELATIEDADNGESIKLADVVAGSVANPEIKRGELMTRIRGADEYAECQGWSCEFWTLTTPSRFHAQKIINATAEANPMYGKKEAGGDIDHAGVTPRAAAVYLSGVWARARAAWKRRDLIVSGMRAAEPHHDGCPHWHLIVYGPARDLRYARRLLRVYALRDSGGEPGARKHRFDYQIAEGGKGGAAYAAKYVSKNINGEGLAGERDSETGQKISTSVLRVDAWAAAWGIRQFQFFGMPAIGIWRALRRIEGPVAVVGSALERARAAADDGDFCSFWRACAGGAVKLLMRDEGRLTQYGDKAAAVVAGVVEGGRRALLTVRNWVIKWGDSAQKKRGGVAFDVPRSGVNNCTRGGKFDDGDGIGGAVFALGF